jgi:N-acetylglucosamine-6-phosphate deacetylase
MSMVIRNATLALPEGAVVGGTVVIEAGKISFAGAAGGQARAPQGAQEIDGSGQVVAPGFIELQLNGGLGKDFTDDPESIWFVAEQLPRYGVTAFLPTIITSPLERVRLAMDVVCRVPNGFSGAFPLGLHLEGPFLNLNKKGAHNPNYLRSPSPELVADWSPRNGVRLATLAPELPGAMETVAALVRQGVVVSAGHSMASYEQAQAAFQAGVRYGTHLFNAMPTLDHRAPGLAGALLTTPSICIGVIPDGIHLHPSVVDLAWKAKGSRGLTLVTDAMAAMGMAPGAYRLGDFDVIVDENVARLPNGTLAGSILTMDAALRNLMAFTGCSMFDALPTLTSTPAAVLGLEHKGQIKPGADADLVLLTPQGQVLKTIAAGHVVYTI